MKNCSTCDSMSMSYAKMERERDEAYTALRKVLKHQPWPGDDASERDFNEARKVLEQK